MERQKEMKSSNQIAYKSVRLFYKRVNLREEKVLIDLRTHKA